MFANIVFAQTFSTALILTNRKAKVIFDGEEKGIAEPNIPYKIQTSEGSTTHRCKYEIVGTLMDKGEVITLETGKQKVVGYFLKINQACRRQFLVADLNFAIPGSIAVGLWANNNPGQSYPYTEHYFAFEKGDGIILNATMTNRNGTNLVEIATYPAGVVKYTNKKFTELNNVRIKVEERSKKKYFDPRVLMFGLKKHRFLDC